jgi:hypothetical protein
MLNELRKISQNNEVVKNLKLKGLWHLTILIILHGIRERYQ